MGFLDRSEWMEHPGANVVVKVIRPTSLYYTDVFLYLTPFFIMMIILMKYF
jgi:hypothetical protein